MSRAMRARSASRPRAAASNSAAAASRPAGMRASYSGCTSDTLVSCSRSRTKSMRTFSTVGRRACPVSWFSVA
jgi:hypothetical protein